MRIQVAPLTTSLIVLHLKSLLQYVVKLMFIWAERE